MARVLLIHTGGTLMMGAKGEDASTAPLTPDVFSSDVLSEVPALGRIADIDTRVVFNLDSADMQPAGWVTLAREVHGALTGPGAYDGVVIVHGTDTMAYTASALAFLLGPIPKPVVLTGAQRPLIERRTDARENLVDAVTVATLDVPEVQIVFAAHAYRGVRAKKRDAWSFEAFGSPGCAPLVNLGVGVDIGSHVRRSAELSALDDRLERSVLATRIFPGLDSRLLRGALHAGVRGLVLEAYGSGTLPHVEGTLIRVIEEARTLSVPVVVVSQCYRADVELERYAGGAAALAAGALSGGGMTTEAAVAKLMVGLGRFGPGEDVRQYLTTDVVGER